VKSAYHSIIATEQPRILHAPEPVATLDFLRGAAIAGALETPWVFDIELDGDRLPHFLGGRIPLVSARLLAVLSKAGVDNIQAFPAVLRLRGETERREHSVLNVCGLLDAADPEASAGGSLVLSRAHTRGFSVFRLFNGSRSLIVDDRLMRALEQQKPPEGWGFAALELETNDPPEPS
jgi:hypothetical protein